MRTFTDAAKKLVLTTAFAALTVFSVSLGNCQAGGSFSVLSYNVDGLPQILQDGRFPGGNPALYTPYIGAKVIPYDIVNVQEDFNSHAALYAADTHPYRTATSGGAGTGSGLNTISNFPFSDDIDRVTWKVSSSDNGNNLTPKGFTWLRIRIAQGVYIDYYNLHTGAGTGTADETDRDANIDQLVAYINANSIGNAVIVTGDTNSRYTRAADNIRDLLDVMTGDPWVSLEQGGVPPAAGSADLVWDSAVNYATPLTSAQYPYEFVDKIFYRNNNYISFTPYNYNLPDATFRDPSGDMLSDHYPLSANFKYTLNPNFRFSDQFGGPHGTSYNDVNSLPVNPVVQAIGMRSGSRVNQVNLTLTNGTTLVHGGTGGTGNSLLLASGEYITSVTLDSAQYNGNTRVFYASFATSLGRTLSGGATTGTTVTYTAPAGWQIVGFHGRCGDELDKAGVIYAPVNQ
jgi:endonuclease/exonuclease/phosphatase family metal-dependent hydrolase